MRASPQRSVLALALVAGAATAAIVAVPALRFAVDAPGARVALETGIAAVALLASYLMLGRFLIARQLDSLLLATGLAVLASSSLLGALLLVLYGSHDWRMLSAGGGFAGSLVIAVAAVVPQSVVETTRARRHDVVAAASFVVVLAAALAVLDALRPSESVPAHLDLTRPAIEHHVDLLVPQVGAIVCCTVAAIGFSRRAALLGDRFYASVAAGTTLAAFARLHYILFAPTLTGLVRTGDAFRFLFYGVLLVGAGREIRSYWRGLADSAVLEERRRIARDLHDGVAQELAFIGRRARRLDDARAREIAAAAERGLNDSRRAIAALTQPLDRDLADVLAEALGDVAGRHGVALDLHLAREVEVDAEAREALARIACEAVANAARHGGAEIVRVELSRGDRIRFAVEDRGRGFDPRSPAPGRFGLTIMRERAEAVGGSFRIASRPGSGTTVEVEL